MSDEPRTNATYVEDENGTRLVPEIVVPEPEPPTVIEAEILPPEE